ncbi:MAG: serine/threonine protein kinase, partial [Planctomycetota bacterium]
MPTEEDLAFGQIALANKMITQEQLEECLTSLEVLENMGMKDTLANILLKRGFLSKEHAEIIYQIQGKKPGKKRIGGYEIEEKLGEGGMGIVYKARQINMDRIVALKILSPQFASNKSYIERFFREARSAGKLDHPNIVRGIDVGEADGFYYFSMEFVEGQTLSQKLKELESKGQKGLGEMEACEITIQVAKALEHAHKAGMVHRDIKPDNIFISKDQVVKLGDMGLAKPQGDSSITQTGIPVGTPYYISPEQATNDGEVDIRSDIYSLGVTLYQMLTGKLPYEGTSYATVLAKRIEEDLPLTDIEQLDISPEMRFILRKMTKKNPAERYANPTELLRDLHLFRQGAKLSPDGTGFLAPRPLPHEEEATLYRP